MEKYNYDGEKFLSKLYNDIHIKQSVIHSSSVSDKKLEKIKKYLEREEKVHKKALNRGKLDLLKKAYYDKYVIKEIPKEYIDFLNKNNFDKKGYHLTKKEIEENKRVIIEDQKKTLSIWIDYLTSEDAASYPWWTKYWAFQGMLKIGAYDSKNNTYGKRDNKTVAPFVELNREALAKSIDLAMKQAKGEILEENLKELISSGSFTKLYTLLLKKQKEVQYDNENINGIWIKYAQGDDYKPLLESLQGYNTGWCTAGEEKCKIHLKSGDFYVYYTKNENGNYKVPRLAIRMDGETKIEEIKGVAKGQNVEQHLEDIVEKKLEDLPDKENYKKRINDSKMLTYVYTKYKYKKELTKEDLNFIYEIDKYIEGFGYKEDPRLTEIKENRNIRKDLATILNCEEKEIGLSKEDLKKETKQKCYYGDLDFSDSENVENINFPEIILGNLYLDSLEDAEGIKLPNQVKYLKLNSIESAENLILPSRVKILNLSSLKTVKVLKLPEDVEEIYLESLEDAEGLNFPETLKVLDLGGIKSAKGIKLPEKVKDLYLDSLESAEGLNLPYIIQGNLFLSSLKSAKGLKISEKIQGILDLSGLESIEGLEITGKVGRLLLPEELEKELELSKNQAKKK